MTTEDGDAGNAEIVSATSVDRLLGGLIEIEQPVRGRHRAGLDALLLAATVPEAASGRLADLGAGVGTAGLAAAARASDLTVVLVENDPVAAALARANAARPANAGLHGRLTVIETDVLAKASLREAAGLARESFDHVICNPPFWAERDVRVTPEGAKARAHVLEAGGLDAWVRSAVSILKPDGRLALIFHGDGLAELIAALEGRVGGVELIPIHPRADQTAHRLIAIGRKGARGRPRIAPGLVLHPPGSSLYLERAEAILRGRVGLA